MRFLLFIILFIFSLSSCVVENKYVTTPQPRKKKVLHVEWKLDNGYYWHHHQFPKRPRQKNGNCNNHQNNHNAPRK